MNRYLLRRVFSTVLTFLISTSLVFFALLYGGGDPTDIILYESGTEEMKNQVRANLGLLDPPIVQWGRFMKNMLVYQDLGDSWMSGRPVMVEIAETLPNTLTLALASAIVASGIGIPLGIVAAHRQGTWVDGVVQVVSVAGLSLPSFVIALLLMLLFAYKLQWLPLFGMGGLRHLILPAVTTGVSMAAGIARMTRSCMIGVLNQEYIITARAKGLPEVRVVMSHGLRNALVTLTTMMGLQLGILMGGTVVTEMVYAWPGIGRLMVGSILSRDFPVVRGAAIVLLASFVVINLIVDLMYVVVDPRIRYSG